MKSPYKKGCKPKKEDTPQLTDKQRKEQSAMPIDVTITSRNIQLICYGLEKNIKQNIGYLVDFNKDRNLKDDMALEVFQYQQDCIWGLQDLLANLEDINEAKRTAFEKKHLNKGKKQ